MAHRPRHLVVVNPVSAGGATGRRWPWIREILHRYIDFEEAVSNYPGHAVKLGKAGRDHGYDHVVCVGGDGTINEVVNGILSGNGTMPLPKIGVVPSGTGADLARTLGIPHRIDDACKRLENPRTAISDLGMVSYRGREGTERRYFVNAAGLGYDAEVVRRRNGFNRYVRGTVPYLASLATALLSYQNKDAIVTLDETTQARRIRALVLGIGRYFGGGMCVAPNALIDDGYFDVVTIGDIGRLELLYNFPGVYYRGTHLGHPKVRSERARVARVESGQRLLVQADGDLPGEVPAQFQILPKALAILC